MNMCKITNKRDGELPDCKMRRRERPERLVHAEKKNVDGNLRPRCSPLRVKDAEASIDLIGLRPGGRVKLL